MRNWGIDFIRWLTHKHFWFWTRNIYGDEIIYRNYVRSEWHCGCGAIEFRTYLVDGKGIPVDQPNAAGAPEEKKS
jgi:hypothetical protein